jgi:hypothetical protein
MINLLILFVLVGEALVLTKLDKIIYGTWITPFSLLAFPYTIVVVTAFLFGPTLGFISLYVESVLIWIVGLLLFWLGGQTIALPLSKAIRVKGKRNQPFLYEKKSEKLVLIFAWIAIFMMSYGLLISLGTLGWQEIGTNDFSKSYGYGWVGHFMCFSMGLTIFLIGTVRRGSILGVLTIFILIALSLMYPVKAWVIIPVLSGFIYRALSGRIRSYVLIIALVLFIVYVIYNVAYLIGFGVKNVESLYNMGTYESLFKHFCSYIFGGVLSLSEIVREGIEKFDGDPHLIFAPFVNLYAFIFSGDMVSSIYSHVSVISIDGNKISNVNTLFGTLLINLGYFGTLVYTLGLGLLAYMSFALSMLTRNCWAGVIWSFIGALLSLGWFDSYFGLLSVVELPVYCAILGFLIWLLSTADFKRRINEHEAVYVKST